MGFNVIYIDGIYNYFHGAYEYNNQWVILTYEFHDAGNFNGYYWQLMVFICVLMG